jgi:hypothetical protein
LYLSRIFFLVAALQPLVAFGANFESAFATHTERVWIGPEYWANPLQDWRVSRGRLECVVSGRNRNVNLLTHQLGGRSGGFDISVRLGAIDPTTHMDSGWAGFRIGISGPVDDYRYATVHGRGLNVGVTTGGRTFIGDEQSAAVWKQAGAARLEDLELRLSAIPDGQNTRLTLAVYALSNKRKIEEVKAIVPSSQLAGNLALVSEWTRDAPRGGGRDRQGDVRGGNVRFWFRDWKISGPRVEERLEQTFGPILWSQYTLSKGVLKMTAQMPPLGREDSQVVSLQTRRGTEWETIDVEPIHTLARTATFRITGWDSAHHTPYRLLYSYTGANGQAMDRYWEGTVRKDPTDKEKIVVAGFTGNQDTGFPNTNTVRNVQHHNPDLLFFSGDQIYENVAGYGIQREPVETAALDYLRKWWLFGWSFGDLMRDRPTVSIPDDHDVYQGNIWGGGGRKVPLSEHERGGYGMPAEWVNMVQRTQASHLPDAYDSRAAEQGIGVYYTDLLYGGVSFAILEDRKFKSGPKGITPPTGGRPDHITDPRFDRDAYDPPGATLLGERQLSFIRDWTSDWRGADFKVALSQTIFAAAATTHGGEFMRLVGDMDTNAWPRSARDRALRALRTGYVFMYAGDTHLPTIIHHGVDEWNDSGWSFAVPSIAAGYPRLFEPESQGKNRQPGMPDYTGEHLDAFGNRMTVWAVANPKKEWRRHPLEMLMDKASGYGIVRLDRGTGNIEMECWPILVDASQPGAGSKQFTGWPKTINIEDNFPKQGVAWLPRLKVTGMKHPVVQVADEATGEFVYTLRVRTPEWHPRVFSRTGSYTLRVGEPGRDFRTFPGLRPDTRDRAGTLEIAF